MNRWLFAGCWCLCPVWHSDHLIVHHKWELSWLCARSCSKNPIAPMGKWLTCLPRLTLAQLRTLRSTTECTCHRDLENFPSFPCETHHCCSMFAGWRCLCPGWHSGNLGVHHQWEHGWLCACSCSKVPIAGRLMFCSSFAGRRCLCLVWHSVDRELPDLLQHSYLW